MHTIFLSSTGVEKTYWNVQALSMYLLESESDSDDGIIANEVLTLSIEEMFVKKFCFIESAHSEQTAKMDRKLKVATESLDVGMEKDGLATSSMFPTC